jgi:hypothetical protein
LINVPQDEVHPWQAWSGFTSLIARLVLNFYVSDHMALCIVFLEPKTSSSS